MPVGKNPSPRRDKKRENSFPYIFGDLRPLPLVKADKDPSFFETINQRLSERHFSSLTLQQISNILWYSAKVKTVSISSNEQLLTQRNTPSAGAIHPIDILLSLPGDAERRSLYYYDPFGHCLIRLKVEKIKLDQFLSHINKCLELEAATMLWFAANINRTKAAYHNPESLVWRDAGALIMAIQLVATALNIRSCAVGTLANPHFSEMMPEGKYLISAGGILLG